MPSNAELRQELEALRREQKAESPRAELERLRAEAPANPTAGLPSIPFPADPRSFADAAKTFGMGLVGQAAAVAEAPFAFAKGAVTGPRPAGLPAFSPKRGIEAVIGGPEGLGSYTNRINQFQRPPETSGGQELLQGIQGVMEPVSQAAADVYGNADLSPAAQTAGFTAMMGLPAVMGLTKSKGGVTIPKPVRTPPAVAAAPVTPGIKELFTQGSEAFTRARRLGGPLQDTSRARLLDAVSGLKDRNGLTLTFNKTLHPKSTAVRKAIIKKLDDGGELTFDDLIELRQLAGDAAGSMEKADAFRGVMIKSALNKYMEGLGPDDMIGGSPQAAVASLREAQTLWHRASKAETIEEHINLAGINASQFSGSGFENALRTQFRILSRRIEKGYEKGFTKAEIAAINKVAAGGPVENTMRMLGKLAPTSIVSGVLGSGAGFVIGGPVGATLLPAAGLVGRNLATRSTIANARNAELLARSGGLLGP